MTQKTSKLINKKISVHAYKYNGWLYRSWEFPKVIQETDQYICVLSQNSHVITSDNENNGHFFHSKINRPCIWYFFKKEWFNMIVSLKNDRLNVYINLASPYLFENNTIKYIDFDIDYLMTNAFYSNQYKILDMNEYHQNAKLYQYSSKLMAKIQSTCAYLDKALKTNQFKEFINHHLLLKYDRILKTKQLRKKNYGKS